MIHQLEQTLLTISDDPLPFMEGRRAEIDAYWDKVTAPNDRLWNGEFFLFSDVEILDGTLSARGHKTDFATFLYWRDNGQDRALAHVTGTTFPHFADGSLLTIKMAQHTANPGRIYFPAGSFDASDIVDGKFDPIINARRELKEEIGLELQASWLSGPLLVSQYKNAFHICQAARLPVTFEQLEKSWQEHRANGGDDEIEKLHAICHPDDIPLEMPAYAAALCRHHFATWSSGLRHYDK